MKLEFSKMQSLGNDFVMLNAVDNDLPISEHLVRKIADRHFGIGCDQVLIAETPVDDQYGFRMRVFNSDGSEVGQCGNGARCFARYLHDQGLTESIRIPVETMTTGLELILNSDGSVTVDMGFPEFRPEHIPLLVEREQESYRLETDAGEVEFGAVSMGNPHCVLLVDDVAKAGVDFLGPVLEVHPVFPQKANIGFVQVVSRDSIQLRVHERGAGETLGCGSGACAAAVICIRAGIVDHIVEVCLPGGAATVEWGGKEGPVLLTGPVHNVYEGTMEICA